MRWRILSGVIGWPALGLAVVYLPARGLGLLAVATILISSWEYLSLLVFPRNRVIGWTALLAGLVCLLPFWDNSPEPLLGFILVSSLLLFALTVITRGSLVDNLLAAALAIAGLVYVVVPLGFVVLIRYLPRGVQLLGFLFVVTWARDFGAFLVGRLLRLQNPHVISDSISPRKTYEGAVGGVLASSLAAVLARAWLGDGVPLTQALALGISFGILGQVGDLVESLIKRVPGVRDSSNLIPGQGGMLDTLDSFIYTGPLLYFYLIS
jgi:phosphatidate cytidylyltransferase